MSRYSRTIYCYVDKTGRLQELVETGRRYFLSRPRKFGTSLTLSTLGAMFNGQAELFREIAAEEWVKKQAEHPCPVLGFDMSMRETRTSDMLYQSLKSMLIFSSRRFRYTAYKW